MKILIITVPLRDAPSGDVPYGSLTIINYLRKHGYNNVELYHIDVQRLYLRLHVYTYLYSFYICIYICILHLSRIVRVVRTPAQS